MANNVATALSYKLSSFMTGNRVTTKELTSGLTVAAIFETEGITPTEAHLEITSANGNSRERVNAQTVVDPDDFVQIMKKSNKSGANNKVILNDTRVVELLREIKTLLTGEPYTDRWMDINEASKYCSVHPSTLRRNVKNDNLSASNRTGKTLFKASDLEVWLRS